MLVHSPVHRFLWSTLKKQSLFRFWTICVQCSCVVIFTTNYFSPNGHNLHICSAKNSTRNTDKATHWVMCLWSHIAIRGHDRCPAFINLKFKVMTWRNSVEYILFYVLSCDTFIIYSSHISSSNFTKEWFYSCWAYIWKKVCGGCFYECWLRY